MNKSLLILFISILPAMFVTGQNNGAPPGFNYQAVARDYNGEELNNVPITVKARIISGSETGEIEWSENHFIETNQFGLFTITIGQGTRNDESKREFFNEIAWGSAPHFIEILLDFNDTQGFRTTGKKQLLSVPYALYSNYAANGGSGGGLDGDTDPTNERQNLSQVNDTLLQLINNDASVQSSVKNDFDTENEIQDLLINNHILKITNNSDANDINLAPYLDNTDNQTLYNKDDSIGITGGNKINLGRFKDNTDNQRLTMEEDSLRISGGNAVSIRELKNPESIYFYAEKTTTSTVNPGVDTYLIFNETKANEGIRYNTTSGTFTIPYAGLYSFYVTYEAKLGQFLKVFVNNGEYDIVSIANNDGKIRTNFMLFLMKDDIVNVVVNSGGSTQIGKATWAGFKVY